MKAVIRRGIVFGLCLAMILGMIPRFGGMAVQADAGSGASVPPIKTVNMGTNVFKEGNIIQFGIGSTDKLLRNWKVLSNEEDRVLLHSCQGWSYGPFDNSGNNSNVWTDSYLRQWLISQYEGTSRFTALEKPAIMEVTLPAAGPYTATFGNRADNKGGRTISGCVDQETTDRLFLLSAKEVETYCGSDTGRGWRDSYGNISRGWWTRSAIDGTTDKVVTLGVSGSYNSVQYPSACAANTYPRWSGYIVPAFYLDKSYVLFTEAANNNNSFAVTAASSATTWNMTLKATDQDLNASLAGDKDYFIAGENVTVNHTPASQVLNVANQTSALLVKSNNEVVAYGKIGNNTSGSSTFQIPSSGIADGDYLLYVFAEQEYTVQGSDYASDLGAPIPIKIHTHTWDTAWDNDESYHWHNCTIADCPVTDNSKKSGYAAHNWGTPVVTKAATCTETGSRNYTCRTCGYVKTEEIPATGHSFGNWQQTAAADCTNAGSEQRICSACGYIETRVIPALGHYWESNPTVDKAATCTEAGSQSTHCSRCAEVKDVTVIPATGHSYGAWQTVVSPSCINQGSEKRVCAVCGHTETQGLDPLGHDWESNPTVDKAATCTEAGSQSVHCIRCDAVNDSQVIPALGHDYGAWQQITTPTCTTKGSEKHVCNRCSKEEVRDIAALGHNWDSNYTVEKAPTCTESGSRSIHCGRCDTVKNSEILSPLGHDWGVWQTLIAATCTTKGSEKHICNRCHVEETRDIAALGHDWGVWQEVTAPDCENPGSEKRVCDRSGCTEEETREIPALGHAFGDWQEVTAPDCENPGSEKRVCGRSGCTKEETREIPALGHAFGDWQTVKEATCTEAGSEKHECTVCGYEEEREIPPAHEWEENYTIDKEPTCTEPGEESVHCKHCDETKAEREIPAKGHQWDEGKITKEPTYTEEGERTYTCTVCGVTRVEPIPMLIMRRNNDTGETGITDMTEITTEPKTTGRTTTLTKRVKTGDNSNASIWVYLMALAAAVMVGVREKQLKRKKE